MIVTLPKGSENRNVGESEQQNKTASVQIYFSLTIQSFIGTLRQSFTESETFLSGSPRSLFLGASRTACTRPVTGARLG